MKVILVGVFFLIFLQYKNDVLATDIQLNAMHLDHSKRGVSVTQHINKPPTIAFSAAMSIYNKGISTQANVKTSLTGVLACSLVAVTAHATLGFSLLLLPIGAASTIAVSKQQFNLHNFYQSISFALHEIINSRRDPDNLIYWLDLVNFIRTSNCNDNKLQAVNINYIRRRLTDLADSGFLSKLWPWRTLAVVISGGNHEEQEYIMNTSFAIPKDNYLIPTPCLSSKVVHLSPKKSWPIVISEWGIPSTRVM